MRRVVAIICLLLAVPAAAEAQKKEKPPKRPKLEAAADTNDPWAYYNFGLQRVGRNPHHAADAFYWAHRLAPQWAEPLYARRVAMHLRDKRRLTEYMFGARYVRRNKSVRAIDSLEYAASLISPFIYRKLDRLMIEEMIAYLSNGEASLISVASADPEFNAWRAYSEGRFDRAVALYAQAIAKEKEPHGLRAARARTFFHMLQYDSAASEIGLLLADLRKADEKDLVEFYESKAFWEYSLGLLHFQLDQHEQAREAYARALTEDLSFYMAHVRLGELALALGDTATAVSELALAAELEQENGAVRYAYGSILLSAGKLQEAEAELRQAITFEPYFAAPYLTLAEVLERQGKSAEAAEQYAMFVARASRVHSDVPKAQARLTALRGGGGR